MLFGNEDVARFIDENFEPVWVSVAPVPIVTVDFGNGNKIKRTFRGNIATYVVLPDQTVVDVLPGLYQPLTYKTVLTRALTACDRLRNGASSSSGRDDFSLSLYHQLASTRQGSLTQRQIKAERMPTSVEQVDADLLLNDTLLNELYAHRDIHKRLISERKPTVKNLTSWIYEDILDVRLSDPFLGFGALLTDKENLVVKK